MMITNCFYPKIWLYISSHKYVVDMGEIEVAGNIYRESIGKSTQTTICRYDSSHDSDHFKPYLSRPPPV